MHYRRLNHLAWLAAGATALLTAQGALAQTSAEATPAASGEVRHVLPRLMAVKDAATGRMRAPTPEEAAAMMATTTTPQQRNSAARTSAKGSAMPADHPMARAAQAPQPQARLGATGRRFDMEKMPYSVAHIGADGKPDTQCVVGEDAARNALDGKTAAAKGGHRHAH
jgi:hypothetical protein